MGANITETKINNITNSAKYKTKEYTCLEFIIKMLPIFNMLRTKARKHNDRVCFFVPRIRNTFKTGVAFIRKPKFPIDSLTRVLAYCGPFASAFLFMLMRTRAARICTHTDTQMLPGSGAHFNVPIY